MTRCKIPLRLIVNVSEVIFVDAAGEEILSWLAELEGNLSPTIAIPATSANACICRWRRERPGPSPGRCNAFADVLEFVTGESSGETNMKDDTEDYPVSYLVYVSCTLVAIALLVVTAFVFLL